MLPGPQNCTSEALLSGRLAQLNLALQRAAVLSGRTVESVTLVAVSKGHPAACVAAAARLGLRDFGENYLQEALGKISELAALPLSWHYIGRLQANKTRAVAERFAWVHTVDRPQLAARLSAQRPAAQPPLNVCLQVNIAADPRKGGIAPQQAAALAHAVALLPRLTLRGLMCMCPEELQPDRRRAAFGELRQLLQTLRCAHPQLDTLSMGMSGDFAEAVEAGATMVRIGTAIFGPRA